MKYLRIPYGTLTVFVRLLVILSVASIVFAADQDVFAVYTLEVEGEIYGYVCGDISGDTYADIIVVYSPADDPDTRYAGLYLQGQTSGFNLRPDYLTRLPQNAAQIDIGDIDGDGVMEVLLIDADGVNVLAYSQSAGFSKPIRLIRQKTIFNVPFFRGIIVEPFLVEINDSPSPEIVLPTARGYVIFERGEADRYDILNQLSVSLLTHNDEKYLTDFSRTRRAAFQVSLATVHVGDCNLDGRKDLYFLWDNQVACFIQDNTGNFPQTPDAALVLQPGRADGYVQSWLADFNGDRRLDIAVSHTSGGITNTETSVRIYLCNPDGLLEEKVSRELRLSDSHCNLMVDDFDRDGRPELAIPAVELGAIAATKMFLMKGADLHLLIYPIVGGFPDDEPSSRRKLEFRFNFDDPHPTREVAVDWTADYNGDNLLDLAFTDGNGHVKFYWGQSQDYLSKKPDVEISLEHPAIVRPVALNSGVMSDAVIEHNLTGKFDRLTVLKNRNNKL